MKKIVLTMVSALAVAATISASNAADMATKAPFYKAEPVVVAPNWSGFYVGGDIGGAFQRGSGTSNFQDTDGTNNIQQQSPKDSSLIGGVYAGYNWQFAPSWVVGIEGDWQWTGLHSSFCRQTDPISTACSDNGDGFANITDKTRSLGTLRGRLGWTFDRMMVYATGGAAFADVRNTLELSCLSDGCGANDTVTTDTSASISKIKTGWTAGAGVEWMFTQNWIARAEYLHADVGNLSNTLTVCAGACTLSWSRDLHYDIVRVGIGYKFGGF